MRSSITGKWDKAQRVARPACANSTVYFLLIYKLAMPVPPSEWSLKTSAVRIFAYVYPYTPEKSPKDLEGYWTEVHKISTKRRNIIVDVKLTIGVAIFP